MKLIDLLFFGLECKVTILFLIGSSYPNFLRDEKYFMPYLGNRMGWLVFIA